MFSDESAHAALSLELLELRPELHCIFGGAEYNTTTLIHGSTSEQSMPLVYSPSPTKAQLCSSVSKIRLEGWSDPGTHFLERWSTPQACQCP